MLAGAASASRPRAPVGDATGGVNGAEVAARGHIARAEVELDPEGLEDAAPDLVAERVVAEEPEVPWPAAGRDPRRHVADETARRLGGERREVRQVPRLELGAARLGARQAPQAVEREHDDLRGVLDDERRDQLQHRSRPLTPPSPGSRAARAR